MSLRLTEHYFARVEERLPPVDEHLLLDYVVGSNGIFARGRRPGLEVCMPISFTFQPLRGLKEISSYVQWGWPKVPLNLVKTMRGISVAACAITPRETLFHLSFGELSPEYGECDNHLDCAGGWHLEMPAQDASDQHVRPLETGAGTSTERAVIELHSHHAMPAEFSPTDNEDESRGFRIYAVIGDIFDSPKIRARVGLFGHFFEFSASEVFELPDELIDCITA